MGIQAQSTATKRPFSTEHALCGSGCSLVCARWGTRSPCTGLQLILCASEASRRTGVQEGVREIDRWRRTLNETHACRSQCTPGAKTRASLPSCSFDCEGHTEPCAHTHHAAHITLCTRSLKHCC